MNVSEIAAVLTAVATLVGAPIAATIAWKSMQRKTAAEAHSAVADAGEKAASSLIHALEWQARRIAELEAEIASLQAVIDNHFERRRNKRNN